jgi:hypothetical protein
MLQWGGNGYYLINSDVERHLNSVSPSHYEKWDRSADGFIMKGEYVQEYTHNENIQANNWSVDSEGIILLTEDQVEAQLKIMGTDKWLDWVDSLYRIKNEDYTIRTYNNKLEDYYPHPWYPDKEIESFECIRMSVYWTVGTRYDVFVENDGYLIEGDDHETRLWLSEALDFPEFFKPIYKGDSL